MRRLGTLLTLCATAGFPAGSRAEDGMPAGPVQVSLLEGELGLARRIEPRTELGLGGTALLLADFARFYGNVRASAVIWGSLAADADTELHVAIEALRYQTVISSIADEYLGLGHVSFGATRVLARDGAMSWGAGTRAVLPTAIGLHANEHPLALDLIGLLEWQSHPAVRVHAHAGALGSIGVGGGVAAPRGAIGVGLGAAWRPLGWLALVLDAGASFGRTAALDHLALVPALRLGLGEVGFELGAMFPVAGRERALAAAVLRVTWAPARPDPI